MNLKRLAFLLGVSTLFLGACGSPTPIEEDALEEIATDVNNEEVEKETFADTERKVEELIEAGKVDEVEKLVNEESFDIGDDEAVEAIKSYIAFLKSDEPMSLRTAKLMDNVEYGYTGVLHKEIEEAIYLPHEEGSYRAEHPSMDSHTGFDYIAWKHNDAKDKYESAKEYHELTLRVEEEKIMNEHLIDEAKDKNPTLGMTREEVEASLWGKPDKINRSVSQYSEREQWVYGRGQYLYFTDGILTSFQD